MTARKDIDRRITPTGEIAFQRAAEGATFTEIAAELGITKQAARQGALRYARRFVREFADHEFASALALRRLQMLGEDARRILDTRPSPAAIRAAIGVEERFARLLGLDKPTRLELVNPSDAELDRYVQMWAEATGNLPAPEIDVLTLEEGPRGIYQTPKSPEGTTK